MANWWSDWQRLRARFEAHSQGLQLAATIPNWGTDSRKDLLTLVHAEAADMFGQLDAFLVAHSTALPKTANDALVHLSRLKKRLVEPQGLNGLLEGGSILAFKLAGIDYHLTDQETRWRSLVERAFLHLDRLIVSDDDVRRKWISAFETGGEIACEQLGGTHLMHHGIWAFKAYGSRGRTDLVLGTAMTDDVVTRASRAAETMVLTEWKLVQRTKDLSAKYAEAQSQLEQYSDGLLAGFEMAATCYAVTVARERMDVLAPTTIGRYTCRHMHVAVEPPTPSQQSRRANGHG